jgi:RNA polymerase-binding transcription factor DksA
MNHDRTTERAELDLLAHIDHYARRAALALPVQPGTARTRCKSCCGRIPRERREALPGVTLCAPCAGVAEALTPAPRWTRGTFATLTATAQP